MVDSGPNPDHRQTSKLQRAAGAATAFGFGVLAIATPFVAGRSTASLLASLTLTFGFFHLASALWAGVGGIRSQRVLEGVLSLLLGLIILFAPGLATGALGVLLGVSFAVGGAVKLANGWRARGNAGWGSLLFDGLFNIGIGAALALQWPLSGLEAASLAIGFNMFSAASRIWSGPASATADQAEQPEADPEQARALHLVEEEARLRRPIDFYWVMIFLFTFLAIHIGRMGASLTLRDLVPPLLATVGDTLSAILVAVALVIPLRTAISRIGRPLAQRAWHHLRSRIDDDDLPLRWHLARLWLRYRVSFRLDFAHARTSPAHAVGFALRLGIPLVAIVVATNPIWGFSWYFNSENWPTAVWERWVEYRVDDWRAGMARAVATDDPDNISSFVVSPKGVSDGEDFSFIIVGDPGEGDPSQHILRDRYLELGHRQDVKFLVVSSDVIYPAGEMSDYESNFYLPFKGFTKPIYAIPGNHDWFDSLDAFAANFFTPGAAASSIRARVATEHGISTTTEERTRWLLEEASRLRREYDVRTGLQRAPFFEIQLDRFALIAIDTGVQRTVDTEQLSWLRAALARARGKFIFALLGHPFYAGGIYQGANDPEFATLHRLLREHQVQLVMAGDTHDLEYYREESDGQLAHHIVNGGGGAYLSIGTALDWPEVSPVPAAAFYPNSADLTSKLDAQVPRWTRPIWWWVKYLNGWPSTPEFLSGAFDFNRAPFFQSFVEVRVEVSANRVIVMPHTANGRLRWEELQRIGPVMSPGTEPSDPVEWILPIPGNSITRGLPSGIESP